MRARLHKLIFLKMSMNSLLNWYVSLKILWLFCDCSISDSKNYESSIYRLHKEEELLHRKPCWPRDQQVKNIVHKEKKKSKGETKASHEEGPAIASSSAAEAASTFSSLAP